MLMLRCAWWAARWVKDRSHDYVWVRDDVALLVEQSIEQGFRLQHVEVLNVDRPDARL